MVACVYNRSVSPARMRAADPRFCELLESLIRAVEAPPEHVQEGGANPMPVVPEHPSPWTIHLVPFSLAETGVPQQVPVITVPAN